MEVSIRAYEPRDLEACRDLWRELTQRHRDIYDDQTIGGEDPGPAFDAYLKLPNRQASWVAEAEGRVAGLTGLLAEGEEGEVEPVVVASGLRSRGIGRQLIETVKADAARRGIRRLSIRPVARNAEALSLFRRMGFDVIGHVDLFMYLSDGDGGASRPELTIHGQDFRY